MTNGCKLLQGGGVCAVVAVVLTMVALIPTKDKSDEDGGDNMSEKLLKRGLNIASA
jgi:hypothetical protein